MISRLVRGIRVGLAWSRAQNLVDDRRYAEANARMREMYKLLNADQPSRAAPLAANLLNAQIAYRLSDPLLALTSLDVVLKQFKDSDHNYEPDDVHYLVTYTQELAEYCAGRFPDLEAAFLQRATMAAETPRAGVQLEAKNEFQRAFPLTPTK